MPTAATIRMKIVALRSSERVRMCGVIARTPLSSPRRRGPIPSVSMMRRVSATRGSNLRNHNHRWLWVPAFAGTTERLGRTVSCFHRPPLQREQAARAFLDEQDDQHENRDLAEHGAEHRLEEFVGDAQRKRADQRAPQ